MNPHKTDLDQLMAAVMRNADPVAVHELRKSVRLALVRLRVMRPAMNRELYGHLRQALQGLTRATGESRDAEVTWELWVRLMHENPELRIGDAEALLGALEARKRSAAAALLKRLNAPIWTRQATRLAADLCILDTVARDCNLQQAARRRYRHALRSLKVLLRRSLTPAVVHALRIQVRKAAQLSALTHYPDSGAEGVLSRRLDRLQAALGDARDALLLVGWLETQGMAARSARRVVAAVATRHLQRCKRRSRNLQPALRRFLQATRRSEGEWRHAA